jgi:exopolysaccharide transport family protein
MTGREQDLDVDLKALFASLRRDWLRIAAVVIVATAAAVYFALSATPHYKGETRLLIEPRESIFTRPVNSNDSERPILDREGVASQVEVIGSADLLRQVARDLGLAGKEEFGAGGDSSLPGRLLILAGLKNDPGDVSPEERVLQAFREKLEVYRVENSRVIVIEFSSEDRQLAAKVPNAIADAYIALQRDAKSQSNADATEWLEPEIADLRDRVKQAEARVAEFRAKSDLLIGQGDAVLATQQLSELSTELSRVRAERGAADAKARSLRTALSEGALLETLPDVLSSGLIQRLREREVQLRADLAELSTTLLDNHPRIRALRSQLADLDRQIRGEAEKVLQGLETETRTAQLREKQLLADLEELKAESARAGNQQVELRALEREATGQRELLESYLTRFREAASRGEGNYLPADARVFSRAIAPSEPYFPKMLPIAGAALFGSFLVMIIATLLRELFSGRAMRPGGAVIAPVPVVAMPIQAGAGERRPEARKFGRWTIGEAAKKLIAGGVSRAIFISPEGDEAAAAAVLVAREVADAGLRTLLLDLTVTGAATRPMLEITTQPGITNLLVAEAQFADVIHGDQFSDCHIIPFGTADPAKAMRGAERLPIIMESLTTAYDVVVVECGAADAESLRRLVADETEILVSAIEPEHARIAETIANLEAGGHADLIVVTTAGYEQPMPPVSDRSAA